MTDPRQAAMRLLGEIDWLTEVSGLCHCPGESLHTHKTAKKDCRVNIDGAPTIHCFHTSCVAAVEAANYKLRRELGATTWEIRLPGGKVVRSGDVVQASGVVTPRAVIEAGGGQAAAGPSIGPRRLDPRAAAAERLQLESLKVGAERFKVDLFERFRWTFADILRDSPRQVADRGPDEQFRTWLKMWPADATVWIGDVWDSGKPEHATHFRPVAEWFQIGPVMGNYTCGSAFRPGSFQRGNVNLHGQRFMVVESDTLSKDEVGAIFAYLNQRLRFNLHAIIDTGGKSLHGWFACAKDPAVERELKTVLTVFGCDPKLFTYSQPVRLPGAFREQRLQRLIWLWD